MPFPHFPDSVPTQYPSFQIPIAWQEFWGYNNFILLKKTENRYRKILRAWWIRGTLYHKERALLELAPPILCTLYRAHGRTIESVHRKEKTPWKSLFIPSATPSPSIFLFYLELPQFSSKKLVVLLLVANTVMKFLCACNLLYPVNTIRIPELLFSLFAFGVYCVFLRIGISKILFTYFLIIDYISAIRGISFMISRAIWSCPPQSWPDVLVCVTLYALTLPLLMVLFRKYGPTPIPPLASGG